MKVLVKSKTDFIHGEFNMRPGEEAVMDSHLADELKHLVEIVASDDNGDQKMEKPLRNKMLTNLNTKEDTDKEVEKAEEEMAKQHREEDVAAQTGEGEQDEGQDEGNDHGDAGEDVPSFSSRAAPASAKKTAKPSVYGAKKTSGKGKR